VFRHTICKAGRRVYAVGMISGDHVAARTARSTAVKGAIRRPGEGLPTPPPTGLGTGAIPIVTDKRFAPDQPKNKSASEDAHEKGAR
jgi:hypothetical protein